MARHYNVTITFATVVVLTALGLGALSMRPFSLFWYPWFLIKQQYFIYSPPNDDGTCKSSLRTGATFFAPREGETLEVTPQEVARGCIVNTPVAIGNVRGLPLRYYPVVPSRDALTIGCDVARKVETFTTTVLIPVVESALKKKIAAILHKGGYECPNSYSPLTLAPDHARGLSFDFAGALLEDGTSLLVERDYGTRTSAGMALDMVAKKGCEVFGTAFGPRDSHRLEDHIHFSTAFPHVCVL